MELNTYEQDMVDKFIASFNDKFNNNTPQCNGWYCTNTNVWFDDVLLARCNQLGFYGLVTLSKTWPNPYYIPDENLEFGAAVNVDIEYAEKNNINIENAIVVAREKLKELIQSRGYHVKQL